MPVIQLFLDQKKDLKEDDPKNILYEPTHYKHFPKFDLRDPKSFILFENRKCENTYVLRSDLTNPEKPSL